MLSTHAYSFRKKAMLAILLSWIGGYTNVLTYLSCNKTFTSHVTGTATSFGRSIGEGGFGEAIFCGMLLGAFLMGAVVSSAMMQSARELGKRSKYVVPLGVEAALLLVMMYFQSLHRDSSGTMSAIPIIGAFAMGLQNATISHISGKEVRTTHLTGVLTDLGLEGVQYAFWYWEQGGGKTEGHFKELLKLSSHHPTAQRLFILMAIFTSFITGVIVATLAFYRIDFWAFAVPVTFLMYLVTEDWRKPILDIREIDPLHDPEIELHGLMQSILPSELGIYRLVSNHNKNERAPNFRLWIDRIPEQKKLVILVVSPFMHFDANAVLDLEYVLEKLNSVHRKLLLADITKIQYQSLDKAGLIGKIGRAAVFPDLEFAIAEATSLLKQQN